MTNQDKDQIKAQETETWEEATIDTNNLITAITNLVFIEDK